MVLFWGGGRYKCSLCVLHNTSALRRGRSHSVWNTELYVWVYGANDLREGKKTERGGHNSKSWHFPSHCVEGVRIGFVCVYVRTLFRTPITRAITSATPLSLIIPLWDQSDGLEWQDRGHTLMLQDVLRIQRSWVLKRRGFDMIWRFNSHLGRKREMLYHFLLSGTVMHNSYLLHTEQHSSISLCN